MSEVSMPCLGQRSPPRANHAHAPLAWCASASHSFGSREHGQTEKNKKKHQAAARLVRQRLALLLAEIEHDAGVVVAGRHHVHNFQDVALLLSFRAGRKGGVLEAIGQRAATMRTIFRMPLSSYRAGKRGTQGGVLEAIRQRVATMCTIFRMPLSSCNSRERRAEKTAWRSWEAGTRGRHEAAGRHHAHIFVDAACLLSLRNCVQPGTAVSAAATPTSLVEGVPPAPTLAWDKSFTPPFLPCGSRGHANTES